jgi:hypothetical protein
MFEKFTEKARRAVFFARYEASQFGSERIEPTHLLLGLVREENALDPDLSDRTRLEIRKRTESQIPRGERFSTSVDIPLSSASKQLLKWATEEAAALEYPQVTPAHFFLAVLRGAGSPAAAILTDQGLDYDTYREAVRSLAPPKPEPTSEILIDDDTLPPSILNLRQLVDEARYQLNKSSESFGSATLKSKPWTRKQALGHLVDLACAHQQWIGWVLADPGTPLPGYPSADWVASQHYATFSWRDLVELWTALNRLLFHVMRHIPEDKLGAPCRIGAADPLPLSQVVESYVEHLEESIHDILVRSA